MDGLFGQAGFTIPAEVNVRLLPRSKRIQPLHPAPTVSSASDSAQGSVRHRSSTPWDRAHWGTPFTAERRPSGTETRYQYRAPRDREHREESNDSRTEALRGRRMQHWFTKSSESRSGEASEGYGSRGGAAPVIRKRQRQRSSVSSCANSERQRLVTDQADYEVIKPLRSTTDSNSNVVLFLIEDCDSQELFVQKRLDMTTRSSRERATSERNALWQIMARDDASAHIVQLVEAFYDGHDDYSHLVLEYCDNGTIEDFIHRYQVERKSLPEEFAWHVLASLASALCTCHYGMGRADAASSAPRDWKMLCHLNVTPSNVWLTSQQQIGLYPRVVLSGFDVVSSKEDIATRKAHDLVARYGDWQWMPPEGRVPGDDFDHSTFQLGSATDVWQVGGVMQAMCRLIEMPRMQDVDAGQDVCGKGFSFALNNIVACCMQRDWRDRPNAVELAKEVQREMLRRAQSEAEAY